MEKSSKRIWESLIRSSLMSFSQKCLICYIKTELNELRLPQICKKDHRDLLCLYQLPNAPIVPILQH